MTLAEEAGNNYSIEVELRTSRNQTAQNQMTMNILVGPNTRKYSGPKCHFLQTTIAWVRSKRWMSPRLSSMRDENLFLHLSNKLLLYLTKLRLTRITWARSFIVIVIGPVCRFSLAAYHWYFNVDWVLNLAQFNHLGMYPWSDREGNQTKSKAK